MIFIEGFNAQKISLSAIARMNVDKPPVLDVFQGRPQFERGNTRMSESRACVARGELFISSEMASFWLNTRDRPSL